MSAFARIAEIVLNLIVWAINRFDTNSRLKNQIIREGEHDKIVDEINHGVDARRASELLNSYPSSEIRQAATSGIKKN